MKLLIDTSTLIWAVENDRRLSPAARKLFNDKGNDFFFSYASVWELTIKCGLKKLTISRPLDKLFPDELSELGIRLLPIELEQILELEKLPDIHRDPFDRLIASQAKCNALAIISSDEIFDRYGLERIW